MKNFKTGGSRGGFGDRDRGSRGGFGERSDRGDRGGFGGRDRGSRGGFGGRGGFGDDSVRTMHRATCAECGNSCEVPFKPTGEKPVYCSTCFGSRQDSPMEHRSERRSSERFDRPAPAAKPEHNHRLEEKLEAISVKLDKLMNILASKTAEPKNVVAPVVVAEEKVVAKKTAPKKVAVVKAVAPKKAVKKVIKKK